jgi:hypothetical protein
MILLGLIYRTWNSDRDAVIAANSKEAEINNLM